MKKFILMAVATLMSSAAMAQLEAGKYFVKNNESGQYLSNGANWGTRSVLFGRGIEYDVTVSGGKYTLKSGIKNTNNALRPSDGFNDQSGAWELIPTEGGYYMYNGTQYFCNAANGIPTFKATPDGSCVWSFVTATERKAQVLKASQSNPVDATVFIEAADFLNSDVKNTAWSGQKVGGDGGSGCTIVNSYNCEKWNAGAFEVSQTITDLPNGTYTVTCQGYTRKDGTKVASADSYENGEVLPAYLFAGDQQTALKSIFEGATTNASGFATVTSTAGNTYYIPNGQNTAAVKFNEGAYLVTIENVVVTDGTLKLGIKSEGGIEWVVFDSFRLTCNQIDLSGLKADLEKELTNAKALLTSPMNKDVKAALETAINTYTDASFTQSDEFADAIAATQTAISKANTSIAVYVQIAAIPVASLTTSGQAACVVTAKYNAGEYVTLAEAQADYRLAVLAQTEDGADFTGAIVNPNFDGSVNGWTDTFTGALNHGFQNNNTYGPINQFMECWAGQWSGATAPYLLPNGKLYQSVELPKGEYTLSADIIATQQQAGQAGYIASLDDVTGIYIYAQSDVLFKSDACNATGAAPKRYEFKFNTTGGVTELGLLIENTNCNWAVMDNVRLVYEGESTINLYQEALKEAADAAADYSSAVCNAAVKAAYATAVADGKALAATDGKTDEEYQAANKAITDAADAVLASVEVYKEMAKINEKAAALKGDAAAAAYADVLATYNNATATELAPFEAAYKAAVAVATGGYDLEISNENWEGQTGRVAAWANPDGEGWAERYQGGAFTGDVMTQTLTGMKKGTYTVVMRGGASYTSGRGFEGATGQDHAFFFANDALQSMEVYDRSSIAAGTLDKAVLTCGVKEDGILKIGIQNITIGANWFVVNLESITYESDELPKTDVDLAVGAAKWSTFIAPFEVNVPAGVTAYTVDGFSEKFADGSAVLKMTAITTIPANTPVVLNAESPVNETVSGVSEAEGMNYTVGLLTGVYGNLEISEGYVLQNQTEKGIGFYAVSAEAPKTVPANHAYLTTPAASEAKAFLFGEATAIETLEALTAGKAQIFDLNGRKLNGLQKGINIVNGKKIMVK